MIAEWKSANGTLPPRRVAGDDLSIGELIHAYWQQCKQDGTGSSDLRSIMLALREVKELYVDIDAREFGPLARCGRFAIA